MIVTPGFAEDERPRIAALYCEAFGAKLGRVLGPERKALALVARVADPAYVLCARDGDGALLGLVGFRTRKGTFVGGGFGDMAAIYGGFGAIWRSGLMAALERRADGRNLILDGICVAAEARGRGVGTALLEAIARRALDDGYEGVRLDVIDSNERARALYERRGFTAVGEERLGPLTPVFGFRSATTMVRRLS